MNDEAHHAYRIRREEPDEDEGELFGEDEEAEEFFKEATVWIDGLDRVHKLRGINFCVDLSATPYLPGPRGPGHEPALSLGGERFRPDRRHRVGAGEDSAACRARHHGRGDPRLLQYLALDSAAAHPGRARRQTGESQAGGDSQVRQSPDRHAGRAVGEGRWRMGRRSRDDPRPPVFILVCKNTAIAKVIYEWLAEDRPPIGHSAREDRRFPQSATGTITRSAWTPRWSTRPTTGGSQGRRDPLDASDPGHGGQDRVAEGPAGPRRLSRGL